MPNPADVFWKMRGRSLRSAHPHCWDFVARKFAQAAASDDLSPARREVFVSITNQQERRATHDQRTTTRALPPPAPYGQTLTRRPAAVPIYQTTSYQFRQHGTRRHPLRWKELGQHLHAIMNPTTDVLEQRIASLEGEKLRCCQPGHARRPWRS